MVMVFMLTMVPEMKILILVVSTSKRLRALAPAPAVMESPREAISPMSCGLSWCTLRWVGGCCSCHNEEGCSDDDGAGVLVCLCAYVLVWGSIRPEKSGNNASTTLYGGHGLHYENDNDDTL